jgi:hypothetical protein
MAKADAFAGEMVDIEVRITRVVDAHQPTFVECVFDDAAGKQHAFHVKLPIVSLDYFVRDADLPLAGTLRATVVALTKDAAGRACATVDTSRPWHEESTGRETIFVVPLDNLLSIESDQSAEALS